jgi:hypothetical protein
MNIELRSRDNSEIIERAINADTISKWCMSSKAAIGKDSIHIHCTGCGFFVKCYVVKELQFLVEFNNGLCFFLCIDCSRDIYKLVGRVELQDQRVSCLFNKSEYWGVIDHRHAQEVKDAFQKAGKCGYFLWEVHSQLPSTIKKKVFLVAVTHVKYGLSCVPQPESKDIDLCTDYIIFRDGKFYLTRRVRRTVKFLIPYGNRTGPFESLSEAIDQAKQRRLCNVCECTQRSRKSYCTCSDINRSTTLLQDGRVQNCVWRLQDLCAFYLRNYSFHYQTELAKLLPIPIRNAIRDIRSVKLFRELVDSMSSSCNV